jgi:hypothetical protein
MMSQPIRSVTRHPLIFLAAIGLGTLACSSTAMTSTTAVEFRVQSPFCSPVAYPFRFSIDSMVVGADTLRDSQTSPRFATTPGQHRLDARATGGPFPLFSLDTIVTVPADTTFALIVDLYCS